MLSSLKASIGLVRLQSQRFQKVMKTPKGALEGSMRWALKSLGGELS